MKRSVCLVFMLAMAICLALPALATVPPELPIMTCQKTVYADRTEYVYSIDYSGDIGYKGAIWDFHAHLGDWTPGVITITPPTNWVGSWDGGTYGCEANAGYWTYGNQYIGAWKITVKPGYGDGTSTFYFTDYPELPGVVVGQLHGVPVPVPEPGSLLALGSGLLALVGSIMRKRR